jgi:hypothetical protein
MMTTVHQSIEAVRIYSPRVFWPFALALHKVLAPQTDLRSWHRLGTAHAFALSSAPRRCRGSPATLSG